MARPTVIQVVPRRANEPDGIGDYATFLAQTLLDNSGIETLFISGTPAAIEAPRQDRWPTFPLRERSAQALSRALVAQCLTASVQAVIVHVSGYGYQKRGVPFWLLAGLRAWRPQRRGAQLLGIFHELFATGRPWSSSFWLSGAQRKISDSIWQLCDGGLTPASSYSEHLVKQRPELQTRLYTMPVFSNVGEPPAIVPTLERPEKLAVFGQGGYEQALYFAAPHGIVGALAEKLQLETIIDIGARKMQPPNRVGAANVVTFGQLSAEGVSRELMSCRFGLLKYDIGRLEKSGVFAAYAAHGVIPICAESMAVPRHGLVENQHFLRWPFSKVPDLAILQREVSQWYQTHARGQHSAALVRLLDWNADMLPRAVS